MMWEVGSYRNTKQLKIRLFAAHRRSTAWQERRGAARLTRCAERRGGERRRGSHPRSQCRRGPQKVFLWMARTPSSSYSRLLTHIRLKVSSEARMEPPIQVE